MSKWTNMKEILDMREDPTIMNLALQSYHMCNKLKDNCMKVGMQMKG
jgi:hypothetical protein